MERKLGVILPRELIRGREMLELVKEVEMIGYDYVVACDHVVLPDKSLQDGNPKYSLEERYTDPLTLLAAVSAVTNNLELFTGVLILPERQTALIARQSADVDMLSNGRLNLGVGVGWLKEEFEALGMGDVFSHRGERIEEQIFLLRQLWTQKSVIFSGRLEQFHSMGISPRSVKQPIPIWMGGTRGKVIDRTVSLADGWMPRGKAAEFNAQLLPRLNKSLAEHQREWESLPVMGKVNIRWEFGENEWKGEGNDWLINKQISHLSIGSIGGKESRLDDHLEMLLKAKMFFK